MKQNTTFFSALQNSVDLDLRDIRGKRHELCYVLLGLMIALFRNRDGNLSSMHRSMENMNVELYTSLGIVSVAVVSRSHLPIILQKVNWKEFEALLFLFFGIRLSEKQREWFAVDGKEMRGSIEKGNTRGEVVVQAVSHKERGSAYQNYYNGKKESEILCVRNLLREGNLSSQKISLDALHLVPDTVNQIQDSNGVYLIGLKENQEELLFDMEAKSKILKSESQYDELDKGHGRIEQRSYQSYNIAQEYFDTRWGTSNFQTLVKVERSIFDCKKKTSYQETAYYISNQKVQNEKDVELLKAVRDHWRVETNNHLRDVTLKEDSFRTKKTEITKVLSGCRTLVINILFKLKSKNMRAELEGFSDNFQKLFSWLRKINFL